MNSTTQWILNVVFIAIAALSVVLCSFAMKRVRTLKLRYKAAIILIPLHYNKLWEMVAVVGLFALAFLSVLGMIFVEQYIIFVSIAVSTIMPAALMIKMMSARFGVLDCGIIVPFRFIDWLHLYDYRIIKGNKVFFFRDSEGYDTIRAISPKLSFDESNLGKLQFLLNKNKMK